jgi:trimeric autotransporter adhesin
MNLLPTLLALASVAFGGAVAAQCQNTWIGDYGCPGVGGEARCFVHWDPDGAGPLPERLVVGGGFMVAGNVACESLALWDPATGVWAALPPVPTPAATQAIVTALAVLPGGGLAAAVFVYGTPSNAAHVATWDGVAWTVLGAGFDDEIHVLHVRPNGDLLAGGVFAQVGGQPIGQLVRWNGAAWQSFAGGAFGTARTVVEEPGGTLLVGGSLVVNGGSLVSPVVRWDGTTWSNVGAAPQEVYALARATNGRLFVGMQTGLFEWTGTTWQSVPGLVATPFPWPRIDALRALSNGTVVVGGQFISAGGQTTNQIAVLDAATLQWSTLGAGITLGYPVSGIVRAIAPLPGGGFVVGGYFARAGGLDVVGIARHGAPGSGVGWRALWDAATFAECVEAIDDLQLVVAGRFRTVGNVVANSVARWDGAQWQPVGGGLLDGHTAPVDQVVRDLLRLPSGDLLAAGKLGAFGSIARFDGTAWTPFATAAFGANAAQVDRLLRLPNGDLVAGGWFGSIGGVAANNIARFDGVAWSPLGAGVGGGVVSLILDANGDLVVAAGSAVLRWTGTQWQSIVSYGGSESVVSVVAVRDGGVMIGGTTSTAFGSLWQGWADYVGPAGYWRSTTEVDGYYITPTVHALPDGDVIVIGFFRSFDGQPVTGSVRIDDPPFGPRDTALHGTWIRDIAVTPGGDRLMIGGFSGAGGAGNYGVARLTTNCPATSTFFGTGCVGSGGANDLRVLDPAWLGAAFRCEASGLAANAIAVEVVGLQTGSVPLASLLPQGQPGCNLFVSPDVLLLHLTGAGNVVGGWSIPSTASLVGAVFHEQFVGVELDVQGAINALTSTNGISATIGAF